MVAAGSVVTYTITFNEDMNAATVGADDFSNAGTAAMTIGSMVETGPGVFTVQATPTTAGHLAAAGSPACSLPIWGAVSLATIPRCTRHHTTIIVVGGAGPDPVDHFAISAITSTQTVGTPITGITLTAQDFSNNTFTSFTGTVTFGGTGGFTGTSGSFIAGVLTNVSVIPTAAGSNLTFTVTDGAREKPARPPSPPSILR